MRRRGWWFFAGFALAALVIAGVLSYFADRDPDGLEYATHSAGRKHQLAGSPFADYAVGGDSRFTGLAGIAGVVVTLVIAGGLFWLLRKRNRTKT
jgi:cobalt/nickel transport protein